MQEEVEMRSVTLSISTAKLTARVLKAALSKYLSYIKQKKTQSNAVKPMGKQTVKQLVGQNQGVANIEISEGNIKSFDRVARKYGVDYAVKKDRSQSPPKYLVFFKARDSDVLTAAFKEYCANELRQKKPSVLKKLMSLRAAAQHEKPRVRNKE